MFKLYPNTNEGGAINRVKRIITEMLFDGIIDIVQQIREA
jgi:hypothetical protein